MRLEDGEHVAAIERIGAESAEDSGIEAAAPVEAIDDTDTVPTEMEGELEDEDEGDEDGGDDDEGGEE
jgi:hypothetical protein